mmetsp:Transcript_16351/g.33220  ORF Transcript_16351/g.33220 Transcript_16351/m.33220 type:complete len:106 (+) Transcript_16351:113-430(+)
MIVRQSDGMPESVPSHSLTRTLSVHAFLSGAGPRERNTKENDEEGSQGELDKCYNKTLSPIFLFALVSCKRRRRREDSLQMTHANKEQPQYHCRREFVSYMNFIQ